MARAAIIIPIFFLLTACATGGDPVRFVTVCPEPPYIERPELDVLTLKEGDTPQKWGLEQEVLLDGYRKEK